MLFWDRWYNLWHIYKYFPNPPVDITLYMKTPSKPMNWFNFKNSDFSIVVLFFIIIQRDISVHDKLKSQFVFFFFCFQLHSQLTFYWTKGKPITGGGLHQIAEFGFWRLLGCTIGNWCALSVGQVYSLSFCLLVGGFIQDVERDGGSTASHQVHHLPPREKKIWAKMQSQSLWVIIDLFNALQCFHTLLTSEWDSPSTNVPLTLRMRSPSFMPASSAGPPISRERIRWPSSPCSTLR